MIYYETKVSYTKEVGDGKMQSTKELYLVQALNYADAEERIIEAVSHYSHDGMPEVDIRKVKYVDIFRTDNPNADKWYKAKVIYVTLEGDGEQMKEKKVANLMLVQAWDIKSALQMLEKNLGGTASDYSIHTIQETQILDYYDFGVADVKEGAATDTPAAE